MKLKISLFLLVCVCCSAAPKGVTRAELSVMLNAMRAFYDAELDVSDDNRYTCIDDTWIFIHIAEAMGVYYEIHYMVSKKNSNTAHIWPAIYVNGKLTGITFRYDGMIDLDKDPYYKGKYSLAESETYTKSEFRNMRSWW